MNWKKLIPLAVGISLIAALLVFALPTIPAAAQTPTPQPKAPPALGARAGRLLEKRYQAAQKILDQQTRNLKRAETFGTRLSDRIETMKAAGKDTSTFEAALAQFQKNIGLAKQKHETAAALLKAHAGFNANGQVTDRPAARETLKDTHAALSEARKLIAEALKAVKEAVKEFRQAKP